MRVWRAGGWAEVRGMEDWRVGRGGEGGGGLAGGQR